MPRCFTRRTKVKSTDAIHVLNRIFGTRQMTFIHKSRKVNSDATFEQYEIKDGDTIIAIDEKQHPGELMKWEHATEERCEQLTKTVHIIMNKDTRLTGLKRFDMAMDRCEVKPRSYRKMLQRYESSHRIETMNDVSCVVPDPPQEISAEPLPIWW